MARDQAPEREPYLRRVLEAFERGLIEPYEYTRRVLAINAATTPEQMAAVVDEPPPSDTGAGRSGTLDAVDLALLRSRPAVDAPKPAVRYAALAFVFILFAVLLGLGVWLGTHVHAAGSAPSGTVRGLAAGVRSAVAGRVRAPV